MSRSYQPHVRGGTNTATHAETVLSSRIEQSFSIELFTKIFPIFTVFQQFTTCEPRWVTLCGMLVYLAQHLGFIFNPHFTACWGYLLGEQVSNVLYGTHLPLWDAALVPSTSDVSVHCLLWFFAVLAVAQVTIVVSYMFRSTSDEVEREPGQWVLLFRALFHSMSTWLMVPWLSVAVLPLVAPASSRSVYRASVGECWTSTHVVALVGALFLLALAYPVACLSLTCQYEDRHNSACLKARSHSLTNIAECVEQPLLVVLLHVCIAYDRLTLFAALFCVISFAMGVLHCFFMPFYSRNANRFFVVVHALCSVAGLIGAIGTGVPALRDSSASSAAFLALFPFVVLVGAALTETRVSSLCLMQLRLCGEGTSVEMENTPTCAGLADDKQFSKLSSIEMNVLQTEEPDLSEGEGNEEDAFFAAHDSDHESLTDPGLKKLPPMTAPFISHVYTETDVELAARFIVHYHRTLFQPPETLMIVYGARIFAMGLQTFLHSPIVHLHLVRFLWLFRPATANFAVGQLDEASMCPCGFVTSFRMYLLARRLCAALGVINQAHLRHSDAARDLHIEALSHMHSFWIKLTEPSMDMLQVAVIADSINRIRCRASDAFEKALRSQTSCDQKLVGRLGRFLDEVAIDSEGAAQCRNELAELKESHAARGGRGGRQRTGEMDVASLTTRLLLLLRFRWSARNSIQSLMVITTAVFILLAAVVCTMIYLNVDEGVENDNILDRARSTSIARAFPVKLATAAYFVDKSGANSTEKSRVIDQLATKTKLFSQQLAFLTAGDGKAHYSPQNLLWKLPLLQHFKQTNQFESAGLTKLSSVILSTALEAQDNNFSGTNEATALIKTNYPFYAAAFNRSMALMENEYDSSLDVKLTWVLIFSVAAFVILAVIYSTLIFSCHRTSQSKLFTFQLFALIPFDALERLSTEAKAAMNRLLEEKKDDEKTESSMSSSQPVNPINKPPVVSSEVLSSPPAAAAASTARHLKSCLKSSVRNQQDRGDKATHEPDGKEPLLHSAKAAEDHTRTAVVAQVPQVKVQRHVAFNPKPTVYHSGGAHGTESSAATEEFDEEETEVEKVDHPVIPQKRKRTPDHGLLFAVAATVGLLCVVGAAVCGSTLVYVKQSRSNAVQGRLLMYSDYSNRFELLDSIVFLQHQRALRTIVTNNLTDFAAYMNERDEQRVERGLELLPLTGMTIPEVALAVKFRNDYAAYLSYHIDAFILFYEGQNVNLPLLATTNRSPQQIVDSRHLHNIASLAECSCSNHSCSQACALLSGNLYLAALDTARSSLAVLKDAISQRQRLDVEDLLDDTNIAVAVAMYVAGAVISLLLVVFVDVAVLVHMRMFVRAALVFVAVLLVASAVCSGMALPVIHSANDGVSDVYSSQSIQNAAISEQTQLSHLCQLYTVSGAVLTWRQRTALEAVDSLANNVHPLLVDVDVAAEGSEGSRIQQDYLSALETASVRRNLCTVASTLTMAQSESQVHLEDDMRAAMQSSVWNILYEDSYATDALRFNFSELYTNTTHDMQSRPLGEQRELALRIAFGERFREHQEDVLGLQRSVRDGVFQLLLSRAINKLETLRNISIALLVFMSCEVLLCIGCVVAAALTLLRLMGIRSAGGSLDSDFYRTLVLKSRLSLLLLFVLLVGATAAGVSYSTKESNAMMYLNLASTRNMLLAQACNELLETSFGVSEYVPIVIERNSKFSLLRTVSVLQETVTALAYGFDSSDGKANAARRSAANDYLMYGVTSPPPFEAAAQQFVVSSCGKAAEPSITPPYGPFGALSFPAEHRLFVWLQNAREYAERAIINDTNATLTSARSVTLYQQLLQQYDPLDSALSLSLDFLIDEARNTGHASNHLFTALLSLLLAACVFVFLFVYVPIAQSLITEEDSARLLLRMIPPDVRDAVPAISEFMETGKIDNTAELLKKFEVSEKLLQNIIPQKIALRLKSGEIPIADMHPCITILFTDLVGFTSLSSTMVAVEIVEFLNELLVEFDLIAELLELEKIKTIGDAYFLAGGLDPRIADHAMRVIEASFMMLVALEDHNYNHPDRQPLKMRLGIHTGPAIAGVVGAKKVAYDLWGPSVAIANAMESTGMPQRIHISQTTADHVKGFYRLESNTESATSKAVIPLPTSYFIAGRLLPTPYQHIKLPRLPKVIHIATKISTAVAT